MYRNIALAVFWLFAMLGLVWPGFWYLIAGACVTLTFLAGIYALALLLEISDW